MVLFHRRKPSLIADIAEVAFRFLPPDHFAYDHPFGVGPDERVEGLVPLERGNEVPVGDPEVGTLDR